MASRKIDVKNVMKNEWFILGLLKNLRNQDTDLLLQSIESCTDRGGKYSIALLSHELNNDGAIFVVFSEYWFIFVRFLIIFKAIKTSPIFIISKYTRSI